MILSREEFGVAFGLFLKAAGVENFTAYELCDVGRTHAGVPLLPPPPELWGSMLPTVMVAEWLRAELGVRIRVNSGYRSPAYNAAIPGSATASQHTKFTALDIEALGKPPSVVADTLERHPNAHRMGIGRYRTFTHFDTRGTRARWAA